MLRYVVTKLAQPLQTLLHMHEALTVDSRTCEQPHSHCHARQPEGRGQPFLAEEVHKDDCDESDETAAEETKAAAEGHQTLPGLNAGQCRAEQACRGKTDQEAVLGAGTKQNSQTGCTCNKSCQTRDSTPFVPRGRNYGARAKSCFRSHKALFRPRGH